MEPVAEHVAGPLSMPPLLYLSSDDIARCALSPLEVADAVRDAFLARALGQALTAPSLHLRLAGGNFFAAKAAVLAGAGMAAVKWFGNVAQNDRRGLADYNPLLLLNDIETGLTVAVMDGAWITATRTAAISAVAAGVLAAEGSTTLGLIGCGRQAAAHLEALRFRYPLERVTFHSRSRASAERLAETARSHGIEARVADDARAAVAGQQIVVSTVALGTEPTGFLRFAWVDEGTFVSMVDMGFSWHRETIRGFDFLATDQLEPGIRHSPDHLAFQGPFDADLAALLADPGLAGTQSQRKALVFAGSGLADVAVAAAVYRRASERGIGLALER